MRNSISLFFVLFTLIRSNTEWSEWGAWSMCDNTCPSTEGNRNRMRVRGAGYDTETDSCTSTCELNSGLTVTLDLGTCPGPAAWSEWHSASQAQIQIQLNLFFCDPGDLEIFLPKYLEGKIPYPVRFVFQLGSQKIPDFSCLFAQ